MYRPKEYWTTLAENFGSVDASGFAPILHPTAPEWFNQAIDNLQFRALRRTITISEISSGARFLDVGCGTGRWVRRYGELGFAPIGVDATLDMLRIARARHTSAPLVAGLACSLPFSDAVFDALSDITVVQHIPYELQPKALQEMVRVLRPGGRMILLELIRGKGSHIFPRPPLEWIREAESCGTNLIKYFGHEFFLADRLFTTLAKTFSGRSSSDVDPVQSGSSSHKQSLSRRIYWLMRRLTVPLSAWTEPIVAKICPPSIATHAIFVFCKKV